MIMIIILNQISFPSGINPELLPRVLTLDQDEQTHFCPLLYYPHLILIPTPSFRSSLSQCPHWEVTALQYCGLYSQNLLMADIFLSNLLWLHTGLS